MSETGETPPRPSVDEVVEAIRAMRVADLLQSTVFTLAQLGFAKLDEPTRDLEQARLAIEALRALLPVAEDALGEELARDLRQTVTNLQLAYAAAVPKEPEPAPEREHEARAEPEGAAEAAPPGEAEPDRAPEEEPPAEGEQATGPEPATDADEADPGR